MREKRKLFSSLWDLPYGNTTPYNLFDTTKNSREFVQKLQLQRKIPVHDGCVNSICWNDTGKYLLSGSDDQRLSIVDGYDYSVLANIPTGHRANIFSAKFLPNSDDRNVVSCSGDGIIIYSHIERPETSLHNKFTCHKGTAYEIMTVPDDPNTFLSCGEDRTVRWFDVRTKTSCNKDDCQDDTLINCQSPVTSLAINPYTPYQLAVGCADASVRMFDRRMLCTQNASGFCGTNGMEALMCCFTVPEFTQSRRITSLCYSADGQEILVSYSSDYIYLFDIRDDLNKKPRQLSCDGSSDDTDSQTFQGSTFRPLMKRLRIRGDWSDTGPDARPEAEARVVSEEPNASRTTIVRTMTDILTRMFHTNQDRADPEAPQAVPLSSQVGNLSVERVSESDEDNEVTMNVPGPSSVGNRSTDSDLAQPSTSGMAFERKDPNRSQRVKDSLVKYLRTHRRNRNEESSEVSSTDSIKKEIEARRKDLIDKHHTEPMVNWHYSGQGASSGEITMDVPTSSTANERQWLEQSASHLPNLPGASTEEEELPFEPPSMPTPEQAGPSSTSDLKRTVMVKIYPPCANLPPFPHSGRDGTTVPAEGSSQSERLNVERVYHFQREEDVTSEDNATPPECGGTTVPAPGSSQSERTDMEQLFQRGDPVPRPQANERLSQVGRDDVELMMEVDSWDGESSSRTRIQDRNDHYRNDRPPSTSTFISAAGDKTRATNEELRKHMSSVSQPRVKRKYTGHRNARTMIKESTFWGDNFIMSGSDCGHIFIWDRHTTELVMLMEADHHVVNCLQPHPFDPILASSGIDYDIKLWAPTREEPLFDVEKANEIIKRNEIMLEETKDTITVPASFMFRMFTTLNHFRTGRAYRWSRAAREMRSANQDANER